MSIEPSVRVEDKLFYNRYLVDAGRAHIKVRPHTTPSPELLTMLSNVIRLFGVGSLSRFHAGFSSRSAIA